MRKKYIKKDFKRGTQANDNLEYDPQKNAGSPAREYEINPSFQKKAFRDLSFNAITVPVDPQGEVSDQADPYAILNKTNQVVDASYPGSDNTSGSIVPQLATGTDSTFINMPDCVEEEIKLNLYYCKTNPASNADANSSGKGTVNIKMDVPYDDICNVITAEAYYDLSFFKWEAEGTLYSNDGKLDVLLNYQSVVQTLANVPLRYRAIRSLEKHLKDMSYYNGSSRLNRLFGMLKKSSFVSLVKSVSEAIMPHYLDQYWFGQTSMLVAIPCRKENAMTSPLIDIIPTYDINTNLKVYAGTGRTSTDLVIDMNAFTNLMNHARNFMLHTSPRYVLSMARSSSYSTTLINTWINGLVDDLDNIVADCDIFRTKFADLLVAFKRMSKVGLTEWKTGYFLNVDKIDQTYQPKFNKLIFDIVRASFTGSKNYKYQDRTGKWELHDLWDKFLGLASYNYKAGGCILTTSTRSIVRTGAPSSCAVPVLFYGTGSDHKCEIKVLTRQGQSYTINSVDNVRIDSGAIARVLGKLIPIGALDADYFKIPSCDISTLAATPKQQGWIVELMQNLFGYGQVLVDTDTYNYFVSPDALCFVDVEIDDQTNAVETFVRQHSPFRVVKTTTDAVLGFKTSAK